LKDDGRLPDAEVALKKSLFILQRLATDFPHTPAYRGDLGDVLNSLATILTNTGRMQEGMDIHKQAFVIFDRLAVEFPKETSYRHSSAGCLHNVGRSLFGLKRNAEAEKPVRQALEIEANLVKEHPEIQEYRYYLSNMHDLLGKLQYFTGRYTEAAVSWRQTVSLTEELEREQPQITQYKTSLAARQNELAWLLANDLPMGDAVKAAQLAQGAVRRVPNSASYHYTLGVAQFRAGNWSDAIAGIERAIGLDKGEAHSNDWFYLAMARWQLGDRQQAQKYYSQAVEGMEKDKPQDDGVRRLQAEAAELLGIKTESKGAPSQPPKE
jgi:tetratricopeptide (TPR) repeat protein